MLNEQMREFFAKIHELNASGYAGVNRNGQIVDRREFPEAVPLQKNPLFGVVEPKRVRGDGHGRNHTFFNRKKWKNKW
jgi:hypothetical protein